MSKHFLILLVIFMGNFSDSARILGVFPWPSYSHFITGEVLLQELAAKGHEVVVITAFLPKNDIKNYAVVLLDGMQEYLIDVHKEVKLIDFENMSTLFKVYFMNAMGVGLVQRVFPHKNVQNLLESNQSFDLVIQENFFNEAMYGFCHRYKAPCVSLVSFGSTIWSNRLTGNTAMASYAAYPMTHFYSPRMSFWQRLQNFIITTIDELMFHLYSLPKHNQVVHEHFRDAPELSQLVYNTSFVLLNSDPAVSAPLSLMPNMKEIPAVHIKESKLPEDIQKFLDDHEDVVYFALGSTVQSKDLPVGKLESILAAFKKWGKPVLWKFEDLPENLPEKLHNMKIANWLPQTAVLAHKNVKVFITHGGKLSTMEAVYFGVPMIGIPIFGDQFYNVAQMEWAGYGLYLQLKNLDEHTLYDSLVEITSNSKYIQEAKLRSKAMHIKPQKSLAEAVFWIEYVLEFNGAPHFRNGGVELPWYQFWMVDVILFLTCVVLGYSFIFINVLFKVRSKSKVTREKKKQ